MRPAEDTDREFIFETYRETVGPYVTQAWGWNEVFQRRGFWEHLSLERFWIILVDGDSAGAVNWSSNETQYFVGMFMLLPTFQRRGIGTDWMAKLISNARAEGKSVRLRVIKVNPAKALYERLGFQTVSDDGASLEMLVV